MSQPTAPSGRKGKILKDPIHGYISLSDACQVIMDTPEFQRLRELKQLGATYYVFPGASHNRFEHCIGVSHLAGKALHRFQTNQPELEIDSRDIKLVQVAGLCHDLGHGPFSHAFEEIVRYMRPELPFHHEQMSQRIFDYMINEHGLRDELEFTAGDVTSVLELISGRKPEDAKREKAFLYDIVANGRNGVDVDKFDYLARDCHSIGLKSSYDSDRLLSVSKVIDGEICYYSKAAFDLYEMFHTRYALHKQVYSHRVTKAIEYMIQDAFQEANNFLHITDAVEDVPRYCQLTDSLLRTIESSTDESTDGDAGMRKAREIVKQIRMRNLYKFVDEIILSPEQARQFRNKDIRSDDIVSHQSADGRFDLQPEDIIVNRYSNSYSMKDKNPVESIHFFTHFDSEEKFTLPKEKVSHLIPAVFQEDYVRVFCRNSDPDAMHAARLAFQRWARANQTASPAPQHMGPPFKRQRSSASSNIFDSPSR